ncbi:ATP-binding protein [candidate division KSB1 bacterium]|nr:ATP-binding protein [candidate division KSB1 bacterium]
MSTLNEDKKFFGDIDQIPEMRKWVIALLEESEVADVTIEDIKVALSEALANIFNHAYKDEVVKPVRIKLMVDNEKTIISLRDFGRKFDLSKYVPPDLNKASTGGYGVYMIRKLMDGVQYFPQEIGTELLMWKSLTDNVQIELE